MTVMGTLMTAASVAAYKPVREAVYNGVQIIEGDLIGAGKAIGSGIDAVTREVSSEVKKVKGAMDTLGRSIDTFV